MLFYFYLGGACAGAVMTMSSEQFRRTKLLSALTGLFLGALLWPVPVVFPLVQWIALRRGWWSLKEVECCACGHLGIVRRPYPHTTTTPQGWFVTIAENSAGENNVWLVCSVPCAKDLHEDPPKQEEAP